MEVNKIKLYHLLFVAILMALIHFLAIRYGFYEGDIWIDRPLHVIGGLLAGMVAVWIINLRKSTYRILNIARVELFVFVVLFSLFASFAWEILEFLAFTYFTEFAKASKLYSPTVEDLLSDMAFGVLGGALFAITLVYFKKR